MELKGSQYDYYRTKAQFMPYVKSSRGQQIPYYRTAGFLRIQKIVAVSAEVKRMLVKVSRKKDKFL